MPCNSLRSITNPCRRLSMCLRRENRSRRSSIKKTELPRPSRIWPLSKAGSHPKFCITFKLGPGDVHKAFPGAEKVFEDPSSPPPARHMPMEPHVTLVYFDEQERLNVWTASQSPSYVRTELANTFGIPMHHIRVRVPYIGGGYGAKLYAKLEPLVTALALITKKPVRYALTREEEFLPSPNTK